MRKSGLSPIYKAGTGLPASGTHCWFRAIGNGDEYARIGHGATAYACERALLTIGNLILILTNVFSSANYAKIFSDATTDAFDRYQVIM